MTCCKQRLTVFSHFEKRSREIAVATKYFLCLGIPYNKLAIRHIHCVEFVKITGFARAASRSAERNLAQASDFTNYIWSVLVCYDIYLVCAFVCMPQTAFRNQFLCEKFARYRINYSFFHLTVMIFLFLYAFVQRL